ncbi:hypothetical protein COOONC_07051, partial [Cooperia oncophora]
MKKEKLVRSPPRNRVGSICIGQFVLMANVFQNKTALRHLFVRDISEMVKYGFEVFCRRALSKHTKKPGMPTRIRKRVWIRSVLPTSALEAHEEAWNAYPYTKTSLLDEPESRTPDFPQLSIDDDSAAQELEGKRHKTTKVQSIVGKGQRRFVL